MIALALALPCIAAISAHLATAAGAPAPRAKHGHGRRCKGGRVAVKVGHRTSCQKPKLKAPALRQKQTPTRMLKSASAAIVQVRFQGRNARAGSQAARHLANSSGLRDLGLLSRRVRLLAADLTSSRRHPTATASGDQMSLPDGWKGEVSANPKDESVTGTVTKNGETLSMTMGMPDKVEQCPDADGKVAGSMGFTFAIDGAVGSGRKDGSLAFLHFAIRADASYEGHTSEDAHLHDFDFSAKGYQHIQVGLKDRHGKVLTTNAPALATVEFAARYTTPFAAIDALDHAFDSVLKGDDSQLVGAVRGVEKTATVDRYNISDGAWETQGVAAVAFPTGIVLADIIDARNHLVREQDAHWLKDCLSLETTNPSPRIAPGATAPFLIAVATRRGPGVAPATITAKADVGTVSPAQASGGKSPTQFSYTSPTSGWKGADVAVRATSKQGAGTTTVHFLPQEDTYSMRWSVAISQQFLGGDEGTGAASWAGSAETLLLGEKSLPMSGAVVAPFPWSTFTFSDHGVPMGCQAGGDGHLDIDGTSSSAGTFEVMNAEIDDGGVADTVATIRFGAPLEHFLDTFHPDATTCPEFTTSSGRSSLDGRRAMLGQQPGVTVQYPSGGGLAGRTYTITGWHPGTDPVYAVRDLDWTEANPEAPATVHIRLELIRHPAS